MMYDKYEPLEYWQTIRNLIPNSEPEADEWDYAMHVYTHGGLDALAAELTRMRRSGFSTEERYPMLRTLEILEGLR